MSISLEAEVRGKSEAVRIRKKLEQDINELEMALDASNRGRQEVEKTIKRYVTQIQDLQRKIDDEQHGRDDSRESYVMTERRCNVLISEVDGIRTAWNNQREQEKWLKMNFMKQQIVSTNSNRKLALFKPRRGKLKEI